MPYSSEKNAPPVVPVAIVYAERDGQFRSGPGIAAHASFV